MKQITLPVLLFLGAIAAVSSHAGADSILNSPHNLSAGSAARIKSATEERVCIFCHTPHNAKRLSDPDYTGPLWARQENLAQDYNPYASDTITAQPGQPQGASRLCLSCHDGTIALGAPTANFVRDSTLGKLADYPAPAYPKKTAVLGKNLRDDHPISIEYGLKADEFNDPDTIRLLKTRGGVRYVECTSCHDPHNNQYGNFLVLDTSDQHDALCTVCHRKNGWSGGERSDHQTGGTRYPALLATNVAKNGCVSCHVPHGAEQGKYLLTLAGPGAGMDTNCYNSCHNGGPSYGDIPAQFSPGGGRYVHPLATDIGGNLHTETENLPLTGGAKHVHCVDCHNPHQALWKNAPLNAANAPAVNGLLKGVRGVNIAGAAIPSPGVAAYEYEICFRCHAGLEAGTYSNPALRVQRSFSATDESERFNTSRAKSFHPVAGSRAGTGASLLPTANTSWIYCSNCHDPHGSSEPHMLRPPGATEPFPVRPVNQDTFSAGQSTAYPLCYGCHDEARLLDTTSNLGKLHKAHVFGLHDPNFQPVPANPYKNYKTSCSVCHDPHGVPFIAGRTTSTNSLHLVNFDLRYVPVDASYDGSAVNPSCSIAGAGASGLVCHPNGMTTPAVYNPYPFTPL